MATRAIFTYGRFNPPTMGHDVLVNKLKSIASGDPVFVFTSQSNDPNRNPFDYKTKTKIMKKAFRGVTVVDSPKIRNMFDAIEMLGKKYDEIVMVVGSDRVQSISRSAVKSAAKMGIKMSVQSAGERDPDAEGSKGMTASKMRAAAARDDYSAFMKGCPASLSKKDCLSMFKDLKSAMGITESWFDNDDFNMFCEQFLSEPQILDRLVQQLKDRGVEKNRAYAVATSQLQKAGVLKKGTQDLTKKGEKRQEMGAAGRAKDRAAKKDGNKPSDYKYNSRTNIATLKDSTMNEEKKPLIRWMDTFEKELKKRGGSYKSVDPVDALKMYYKGVDPRKAAAQLKEQRNCGCGQNPCKTFGRMNEAKKDPTRIVSGKISKLKDKERELLASAINMSGGAAGAPMANRANLDRFNDGVIIPAMTFLRKNMSSLTPEGKKLGKKIISVLGESVELDESRSDFDVDASPMIRKYIEQGKGIVASANSTLGGNSKFVVMKRPTSMGRAGQDQFMMATISDPSKGRIKMFAYHGTHPSKDGAMKMGKSRKLAESVGLDEAKATPRKMGKDLENRLKMTKPSEYSFSTSSTDGGTFAVIPIKTSRSFGQAGVMLAVFDKGGNVKNYWGTFRNTDSAKKFGKREGLIESVTPNYDARLLRQALVLGKNAFKAGKKREPLKDPNLKKLRGFASGKGKNDVMKQWLKGWDEMNLKDDVQLEGKFKEPKKVNYKGGTALPSTMAKGRKPVVISTPRGYIVQTYNKKRDIFSQEGPAYKTRAAAEKAAMKLESVQFNESISFEFPSDEAAEKFMKEISKSGLGTSRSSGDGKVSTTTNSGRTDTPTMAHRDIARLMKKHGGKFVRSNEGPRVSKVFEAFADRKVVSTPSLGSLNAPSSNFRMNLPPTGKMKKQMQQIMKKDASYRRKMSNLVQKSETQKDGTITLHFSSARKRTSFQKLLHQGIKEGLCEERDYKKEYQNYHSKPEQRLNRSKRVLARRKMIKSGRAEKGDGKDVDHKDGNPQNNSPSNLRMMSVAQNRSRNNNKNENAGEEGTNNLVDKYRDDTPGQ